MSRRPPRSTLFPSPTLFRSSGRPEAAGEVERGPAAAAAPARGRAGHERALPGCVPPPDGTRSCGALMRIAPEGWPFILPGWALVAMGALGVGTGGGGWGGVVEGGLLALALWLTAFF